MNSTQVHSTHLQEASIYPVNCGYVCARLSKQNNRKQWTPLCTKPLTWPRSYFVFDFQLLNGFFSICPSWETPSLSSPGLIELPAPASIMCFLHTPHVGAKHSAESKVRGFPEVKKAQLQQFVDCCLQSF